MIFLKLDAPDLIAKQLKDAENLTAGLTPEKVAKSLRDDFDSMDNQVQRASRTTDYR